MNNSGGKRKDFIGYEYKEIETDAAQASLLIDGYESFGWEMDENLPAFYEKKKPGKETKTVLRLKRNRKIVNKMELTRLQRNFEACIEEIASLEKSKTSAATVYALIVALIEIGRAHV